jgi:hypothetical protein
MNPGSSGPSDADILQRDWELRTHLESLGLASIEDYKTWCAQNGFSTRIHKHWRDRCKERYTASRAAIERRLTRRQTEKRKPGRTIQRIFDGELDESDLTQPELLLIHQTVTGIEDEHTRDALLQLLLHVEETGLLTTQPAFPPFGEQNGNNFIEGLIGLARHCGQWIRPLKSWKPRSHNARRQFSSLAGHLLAKYHVPRFMDSVWFLGQSAEAARQQAWYVSLGNGQSPRDLDLPVSLTKRMAFHFLQAPKDCSVRAALRWGQVIGLGGNGRLVAAILGSRMGTDFDHDDFWITVIRWFIQNPTLDPVQTGPLIDYIHYQRFEPQEIVTDARHTDLRPLPSDFSMKGRTAASLMRDMNQWHARLRKEPEKPQLEWQASRIGSFDWTEGVLATNNLRRWTIIELLSRKELYDEGHVLRHCVASYDNCCAFGGTSIWSMGVERNLGRRKRVLTIEVVNASKVICQVRGKANRLPNQKEMDIVRRWACQEALALAEYVGTG